MRRLLVHSFHCVVARISSPIMARQPSQGASRRPSALRSVEVVEVLITVSLLNQKSQPNTVSLWTNDTLTALGCKYRREHGNESAPYSTRTHHPDSAGLAGPGRFGRTDIAQTGPGPEHPGPLAVLALQCQASLD